MLDYNGIIALGKEFPGKKANRFIEWFTYSKVLEKLLKHALTDKINDREMYLRGIDYSYYY